MRLPLALLAALLVAGCAAPAATPDPPPDGTAPAASFAALQERYTGAITSARAGPAAVTPDQLSMKHRELFVHDGVSKLVFDLSGKGDPIEMRVRPPSCAGPECESSAGTGAGVAVIAYDGAEPGIWRVQVDYADLGGGQVEYELVATKSLATRAWPEMEAYEGRVIAANAGAIRISPDQLGQVYREFWVHEGTTVLEVAVEASQDLEVVLGRSGEEGRDRASEEGHATQGGRLALEIGSPEPGGWYVIFFHPMGPPGARDVDYRLDVVKR